MSAETKIEWTDKTWNPVRGCSRVSPGCDHCYAMGLAHRFSGDAVEELGEDGKPLPGRPVVRHAGPYHGLTVLRPKTAKRPGVDWSGRVRFVPEMLGEPLRWREPKRVFVNSMSDLFHEGLTNEQIDQVFAVMHLAERHTFQCLTKRPSRALAYLSAPDVTHRIAKAADALLVDLDHDPLERWAAVPGFEDYEASTHGRIRRGDTILQEQINERFDRPSVSLWRNNEPTTKWVHALVLLAHVGKPPGEEECCHRNGNPRDNRLANLRWGSRQENQQEKVRHGSNGGPAKLTRERAAEIRAACSQGETQQAIADRFGVSRSLISMIKDRRVWPDALTWPLPNVWLGVSVENRAAKYRIDELRDIPAAVRFLSLEPLLEDLGELDLRGIDWVIVGGESGNGARPFDAWWAVDVIRQCKAAGVACFVKQLGSKPLYPVSDAEASNYGQRLPLNLQDRKGGDMSEWFEHLRVRQFPEVRP